MRKRCKLESDPTKSWNAGTPNIKDLADTLSDSHLTSVHILNVIKKELIPNCKHSKKMRDGTNGNGLHEL